MNHLLLAFRSLAKTPLVTLVAVLSLALGIGANAAIFSIFERMILRPLPVEDPHRLVNLSSPGPKPGSQSTSLAGDMGEIFSYPMFRDLEEAVSGEGAPLTGLAAHRAFGANLAIAGGETLSDLGLFVSGGYFEVLGLWPAHGRLFDRRDDRDPGAHRLVVLSHAFWRSRFDARASVLGESLLVNGQPLEIIGVAPRAFEGTSLGLEPKLFVPISLRETLIPEWTGLAERRSYWAYLFGRLSPSVSREQAMAALEPVYRGILLDVEVELQEGVSRRTLEAFANKKLLLEPGFRGQSLRHEEVEEPLLLLLGITGFVLLIAAANLANLLLVKAANRANEIAIRQAVGARRHQLVLQLLTESFVLALVGGACGLLVAQGTLDLIVSILPQDGGFGFEARLGPSTWIFLGILSLVTGLAGLFPALNGTREDLASSLRSTGRSSTATRAAGRFRAVMVTAQIALSMALLVGAGLFMKSLVNVSRVDLGLEVEHIASFGLSPELNGKTPAESRALFARVEEEVGALPGVRHVVASRVPLIAGSNWGSNVRVEGFEDGPDVDTHANFNHIGPGYFRALDIPLLAGREFEIGDDLEAPEVAIVNQTFAHKFGLGRTAVGKRMQMGGGDGELEIEIVGLVADAKYSEVKQTVPPLFFLPYRQDETLGSIHFYVRSAGDPEPLLSTLRGTVERLDPNLPVDNLRTLALQVRENVYLDRLLSTLSAAFAVLATLLAAIGLYGVLAYSVARRTHEIGLRMALGADARRIRSLVLGQVSRLTLTGGLLGLFAALALGRGASALLYGLESYDPAVIAFAVVVLGMVAVGAGLVPAERAARTDPMRALREE